MPIRRHNVNETDARVIVALAHSGLKAERAARSLHYSRNTVEYHIQKIKQLTNKDPRDFFDMCDLLKMAEEILKGNTTNESKMSNL